MLMLCSNPAMSRFTRYNIMIQFVSNLPEVGGFLQVIPIFTINKTDHHDIAEVLLKVKDKRKIMIYKTLHRKLKIEQHNPH
jgi:hypothetical protein